MLDVYSSNLRDAFLKLKNIKLDYSGKPVYGPFTK